MKICNSSLPLIRSVCLCSRSALFRSVTSASRSGADNNKGLFYGGCLRRLSALSSVLWQKSLWAALTPMRGSIQATTMKASAARFRANRRRESHKTSLCAFFRIVLGRSVFWGIIICMENSVSITQRVWAKGNPPLTAGLIPLMITGLVLNLVHWLILYAFVILSDHLGFNFFVPDDF